MCWVGNAIYWDREIGSPMAQLEVSTQYLTRTKASCCPVAICWRVQQGIGAPVLAWVGICQVTRGVYPLSCLPPS